LSFEDFHKTMANISLIRLVDPESEPVKNAVEEIVFNEQKIGRSSDLSPDAIKVNTEIIYALYDSSRDVWRSSKNHNNNNNYHNTMCAICTEIELNGVRLHADV